jgi:hypothetical protein
MLETSLRTGVVEKIMNGEETLFLPQFVIEMMMGSAPLRELIHAVTRNGSSAYDDGDDDGDDDGTGGEDDTKLARSDDQARCEQPIGNELLKAFEEAFSEPPAGNKSAKSAGGIGVSGTAGGVKTQVKVVENFDIKVYNKTLRIYPGVFFGLLSEDRKQLREYACVTQCFTYKRGKFVRLEMYKKYAAFDKKTNVREKVRELEFPGLKPHATRRFTFRNAAQLTYPLHVLHACPRKLGACGAPFACGIQGGGDHDVATYPQYVLNTYHVGTVNF